MNLRTAYRFRLASRCVFIAIAASIYLAPIFMGMWYITAIVTGVAIFILTGIFACVSLPGDNNDDPL